MLAVDHVIIAAEDLRRAAADLELRYGLASVAGGRHPSWGTANRIVPLGDMYLELVAVVEPAIAAGTPFGTRVAAATPGKPIGWAVRTDSIEAVGRRLDLPVVAGSRATPDGTLITWRSVGVDVAMREPALPFFIEWGTGTPLPGATPILHPGGATSLERISIAAEAARLSDWLGDHDLPVVASNDPSRLLSVTLSQEGRELTLPAAPTAFEATPG